MKIYNGPEPENPCEECSCYKRQLFNDGYFCQYDEVGCSRIVTYGAQLSILNACIEADLDAKFKQYEEYRSECKSADIPSILIKSFSQFMEQEGKELVTCKKCLKIMEKGK